MGLFFRENITFKQRKDEEKDTRDKREKWLEENPEYNNGHNLLKDGWPDGLLVANKEGKVVNLGNLTLSLEEQRVIRDKHYTPEVMLKMWNMIKQRQYEVPLT